MRRLVKALFFLILFEAATAGSALAIPETPGPMLNGPAHNEAIEQLKLGEFRKVVELEKGVLERDPADLTARFMLAIAYLGLNEEKKAVEQAILANYAEPGFGVEIYGAMGRYYITKRRFHKALVYFKEALKIKEDPGVLKHVASIYLGQGLLQNAKEYLEKLVPTDPDYLNLSRIYLAETDFEKAVEYANEAIKTDPDATGAYLVLGTAHLLTGKLDQAEANFRILGSTNPDFFLTSYFMGVIDMMQKDYKGALNNFRTLITSSPRLKEGYLNASVVLHLEGKLDAAADMARKALKEDPLDPVARMVLGSVYLSQKEYDKAHEELAMASDAFPEFQPYPADEILKGCGDCSARFSLALIYNRAGLFRQTAELIPEGSADPLLKIMRARALQKLGDTDGAETEYQRALQERPEMVSAYIGLGEILEARDDGSNAVELYKLASQKAPDSVRVRGRLAEFYGKTGEVDKAVAEYMTVIAVSPGTVSAYRKIASLMADAMGDLDGALEFARTGSALAPEDVETKDTLGWIYYRMGMYREALDTYQAVEKTGRANPVVYYRMGLVYLKLDMPENAMAAFEMALDQNDEFTEAPEAKWRLKILSGLS
ncbi:MAG TPA: hypothetical protein DDW94_03680 [Deltaproteobacteria bacterium]|nr:MAG: hypothetical protein A2Z79_10375 [Deltaproteobacteria bacterium GWA2_55_82]OGQ62963.1 MAG: hypothetical protein A3I81_06590 [Deltaproteobacteria bacterium RIFCSPLOWO2_02_FULL_55_12]OIJ72926.1 MAG: hypothetical protein A2V21_300830 [Deltaproteobacteria bacterium GWC2_55_46]HBG46070.1 hypothetical protein [Deltaproteobacteria bacterium]HCY11712.1 hypothetical protein [Deltaproteobacteria bacterium]